MQRELTQKAAEGLFYRKSNLYNPSVTLTRATSLYTREAFFYLPEGKEKTFDMQMSKVPLRCFCHSRVCGIFVLLILLFFGIKFGETTQKVIALVATTFKPLLSVAKTNSRLSGRKFCAGNIYYLS